MKREALGLLLLITPIPLIVCVLLVYAITNFILTGVAVSSTETSSVVTAIGGGIRIILGLTGLVAIIGIPIGMPVGIYLLYTLEKSKK